ncbi:TIGR02587 family membrane protein [Sphingomonas sp.]|uniref:TIGR02587 family membrane protein n=1 Tax=Sphingomonas sp. TaxID=28214 RepID=UPI0017DCFEC1|nr:TIGR02587 family membrane protein [Sphingomonas sp.]MBA3511282.1 TIGR02587 family membrane protein [Sphingomonas sp.]
MQLVNFEPDANRAYAKGLGRALAGAVIFSLPLLMTMEMWWLGFYLDRLRLLQFLLVNLVVLVGLSHVSGFEATVSWMDDLLDALSAYALGVVASATALWLFGVIEPGMPHGEIIGKVAVQSVPASFGAMLAGKQLGEGRKTAEQQARSGYVAQLFLMMAGALFLGFNLAPTDEMVLISFRMTAWHSLALVLVSIVLLHALVYTVGFKGEKKPPGATGFLGTFFRFSIVGYGIALLVSLYVLWTFGRTDGVSAPQIASMVAVLAFPGAIGAAIARLVV